jgi:hypothetical protein
VITHIDLSQASPPGDPWNAIGYCLDPGGVQKALKQAATSGVADLQPVLMQPPSYVFEKLCTIISTGFPSLGSRPFSSHRLKCNGIGLCGIC